MSDMDTEAEMERRKYIEARIADARDAALNADERASKYKAERDELRRQLAEAKSALWKQPDGLAQMPCEICGEVDEHLKEAHKWFHSAVKTWSDRYHAERARANAVDTLTAYNNALKAKLEAAQKEVEEMRQCGRRSVEHVIDQLNKSEARVRELERLIAVEKEAHRDTWKCDVERALNRAAKAESGAQKYREIADLALQHAMDGECSQCGWEGEDDSDSLHDPECELHKLEKQFRALNTPPATEQPRESKDDDDGCLAMDFTKFRNQAKADAFDEAAKRIDGEFCHFCEENHIAKPQNLIQIDECPKTTCRDLDKIRREFRAEANRLRAEPETKDAKDGGGR